MELHTWLVFKKETGMVSVKLNDTMPYTCYYKLPGKFKYLIDVPELWLLVHTIPIFHKCKLVQNTEIQQARIESQYRDLLQAGWSGGRILVEARFSTPIKTG